MSRIEHKSVRAVLVGGLWFEVEQGSFMVSRMTFEGDAPGMSGQWEGFAFESAEGWIAGPREALQAVRYAG